MPIVTCVGHRTIGECDLGIPFCCNHSRSGTNEEGTPIFEVSGQPIHLVTHTGPCNCPHGGSFKSVEGSGLFEVDDLPVTLVGHKTVCMTCGVAGKHSTGNDLLEVEK